MTKTLTTERLREIAEHRSPSLRWGEAEKIAAECLANREAVPVGFTSDSFMCELKNSGVVHAWLRRDADDPGFSVKLYTAPPAPAPAVPDSRDAFESTWADVMNGNKPARSAVEGQDYAGGAAEFAWKWWQRAAMLAQPVSQGCKLNSPEIPDGCQWTYDEHDYKWDSGCGEAWMFSDGGPTENGVKFCQSCGKPVLLAAAPEGGNDAEI